MISRQFDKGNRDAELLTAYLILGTMWFERWFRVLAHSFFHLSDHLILNHSAERLILIRPFWTLTRLVLQVGRIRSLSLRSTNAVMLLIEAELQ